MNRHFSLVYKVHKIKLFQSTMGGTQVNSFSSDDVESLEGKVAIVTGGNAGIGLGIVNGLVSKGATVIIASRNKAKVEEAVAEVKKTFSRAKIEGMVLDVSSFSAIDAFVENVKKSHNSIDILINNAAVMMTPHVQTEQGFEVTLGTFV